MDEEQEECKTNELTAALVDMETVEQLYDKSSKEFTDTSVDEITGYNNETYSVEKGAKKLRENMKHKQERKNHACIQTVSQSETGIFHRLVGYASVKY